MIPCLPSTASLEGLCFSLDGVIFFGTSDADTGERTEKTRLAPEAELELYI